MEIVRNVLTGNINGRAVGSLAREYLLAIANQHATAIAAYSSRQKYLWDLARLESLVALGGSNMITAVGEITGNWPRDATWSTS